MTTDPLASPLRIAAQPELTGGRRVGVLLSHGFTGQPASIKPWGEHLGALGYAVSVPRLPGHGTTWQECNTTTWDDWYGELTRAFDALCLENDAVVVGGLSMGGALSLRLAADHADQVSGLVLVNPAVATRRLDVKLLPVLKHVVPSFPGLANDIKRAGADERGYDRTPLKAIHSLMRAWPPLVADLPKVTCPILYLRSTVDHVVDEASQPLITGKVSSRDVTVVTLTDSYHVATLDNDAPRIFDESAAFVARTTAA
ncbi:carboxylesterase [Nocardioides sp. cx-173]|uniref:alpha/beta hydrolase n=1 Tax=Nocardioides sp. cx-173 TaxID=2898796 RepID=UPI001E408C6C|nr:alpha/beta fold hydrolase [Nocardioides sp. cx-173]MCD4524952.1 alpha/beta fold hydrolase [Nocardioides sp. cx-173]UGB43451.1 alpha/beta fold hydrolase [Nocardioides sp. cx-173]